MRALRSAHSVVSSQMDSIADVEAGRNTEARLINRRMARPDIPETFSDELLERLTKAGPQPLLIASSTFSGVCATRSWIVALEDGDGVSRGELSGGSTSTEGLWRLLDARRREIDLGRAPRTISTCLIGVQTLADLADHMKRFFARMSDPSHDLPPEAHGWDRLLWYMSGNYIEALRLLASDSDGVGFLDVPLSFDPRGQIGVGMAPDSTRRPSLTLHCTHLVKWGVEARWARILNPVASGYAMRVEDEIVASGKGVRKMFDSVDQVTVKTLARIVGLVTALWPEY
jgi:hypothetical protein